MKKIRVIFPFLISIIIFANFCVLTLADTTINVYADEDAHVYSRYPDDNYGDWTYMYCGIWDYANEAYIHFDLISVESGWKSVKLFVQFYDNNITMNFVTYKIAKDWSENSITWNNKPAHGIELLSIEVPNDQEYYHYSVDVSSYITQNEFSICICASYNQGEVLKITSSEFSEKQYTPHLIFTYSDSPSQSSTPPTESNTDGDSSSNPSIFNYTLLIVALIVVIAIVLISFLGYYFSNNKVTQRIFHKPFPQVKDSFINIFGSPIEESFWRASKGKINGLIPQYEIGKYRVDFAIPDKKIAIECDGYDWHSNREQMNRDYSRIMEIKKEGWDVIRFTGSQISRDVNKCVEDVIGIINAKGIFTTKFCPYCGKPLKKFENVCSYCGTKIES